MSLSLHSFVLLYFLRTLFLLACCCSMWPYFSPGKYSLRYKQYVERSEIQVASSFFLNDCSLEDIWNYLIFFKIHIFGLHIRVVSSLFSFCLISFMQALVLKLVLHVMYHLKPLYVPRMVSLSTTFLKCQESSTGWSVFQSVNQFINRYWLRLRQIFLWINFSNHAPNSAAVHLQQCSN